MIRPGSYWRTKTQKQCKISLYDDYFNTSDKVQEMLSSFYPSVFYASKSRAMRAVRPLANLKPASSAGSHLSVVANVKASVKANFRVFIDDGDAEIAIFIRFFDPQTYRRDEI